MKKTKFLYAFFSTLLGMHEVGGNPFVSALTIRSWLSNLVNYYKAFVNLKMLVERRHVEHVLDLIYKREPHTLLTL
jgi:hypothetical protein